VKPITKMTGLASESVAMTLEKRLQIAIASKNFDQLAEILRDSGNLNRCLFDKENGLTTLQQAAISGQIKMLEALIKVGAEIDFTTDNGSSALHLAAFSCNGETARFLLDNKASTQIKDSDDYTPLDMIALGVIARGKIKGGHTKDSSAELTTLFLLAKETDPYSTIKIALKEISCLNSSAEISTEEKIVRIKLTEIVRIILAKTTDLRRSPEEDLALLALSEKTSSSELIGLIKVSLKASETLETKEDVIKPKSKKKGKSKKRGERVKKDARSAAGASFTGESPEEDLKEGLEAHLEDLELSKDEASPSPLTTFSNTIERCLERRGSQTHFDPELIEALPPQLKELIERFKTSRYVEQCMMFGSAVYGNKRRPNDLDFCIVVPDGSLKDEALAKHFFDSIPPELCATLRQEKAAVKTWKISIGSPRPLAEITFSESSDYLRNPSWTVTPEAKFFNLRTSNIEFHPSFISHDSTSYYFLSPQEAGSEPPFVISKTATNLTLRAIYASLPHGLPKLSGPDIFALGVGLSSKTRDLVCLEEEGKFSYLVDHVLSPFKEKHKITGNDEKVFDYEVAQILKTLPLNKLPAVKAEIARAEAVYRGAPSASPAPTSGSAATSRGLATRG
jgi:hypothetical protein